MRVTTRRVRRNLAERHKRLYSACLTTRPARTWSICATTTALSERRAGILGERQPIAGDIHEVLELVARGRTNKEIALGQHLSQATVKTHLLHIFSKLQVDDRTQAVTAALEAGVLRLDV